MTTQPEYVDRELFAVLATLEPLGDRIYFAIKPRLRICNFDLLRENGWSTGELALIAWAENLWTGRPSGVDVAYIATMSGDFLTAALAGLEVYRGSSIRGSEPPPDNSWLATASVRKDLA